MSTSELFVFAKSDYHPLLSQLYINRERSREERKSIDYAEALAKIAVLSTEEQYDILMQSIEGNSLLQLAAIYYEDLLPPLIEMVSRLSPIQQRNIHLALNAKFSTALIQIANLQPKFLAAYFSCIESSEIPDDIKAEIYLASNILGFNTLMISVANNNLDDVAVAYSVPFSKLPPRIIENILMQKSEAGRTALHFAIQSKNQAAINFILSLMERLPLNSQQKIWLQISASGNNALMYMTNDEAKDKSMTQISLTQELLSRVSFLFYEEPARKKLLLSQTTKNDFNALMIAAFYYPQLIPSLLPMIYSLKDPCAIRSILLQKHIGGFNVLCILLENHAKHPEYIGQLLSELSTFGLPESFKADFTAPLLEHFSNYKKLLKNAPEILSLLQSWLPKRTSTFQIFARSQKNSSDKYHEESKMMEMETETLPLASTTTPSDKDDDIAAFYKPLGG
jgi:hypothetical protein